EFIETCVRNTGMGIPFTELEKIFDPFYQVMEGDIPATVGTGIGLSLVKGITEIHHGIVIAESSPGEWAQFRVILPLGKEHLLPEEIFADYISSEHLDNYMDYETSEVEATKDVPQVQNKKKFTILLIDDNDEIRDYIRQRLIDSYNVLEASNGKEGLSTAIRVLPDLVISDIMMPEIDGLQLCLQLKKDIITSHIPV